MLVDVSEDILGHSGHHHDQQSLLWPSLRQRSPSFGPPQPRCKPVWTGITPGQGHDQQCLRRLSRCSRLSQRILEQCICAGGSASGAPPLINDHPCGCPFCHSAGRFVTSSLRPFAKWIVECSGCQQEGTTEGGRERKVHTRGTGDDCDVKLRRGTADLTQLEP